MKRKKNMSNIPGQVNKQNYGFWGKVWGATGGWIIDGINPSPEPKDGTNPINPLYPIPLEPPRYTPVNPFLPSVPLEPLTPSDPYPYAPPGIMTPPTPENPADNPKNFLPEAPEEELPPPIFDWIWGNFLPSGPAPVDPKGELRPDGSGGDDPYKGKELPDYMPNPTPWRRPKIGDPPPPFYGPDLPFYGPELPFYGPELPEPPVYGPDTIEPPQNPMFGPEPPPPTIYGPELPPPPSDRTTLDPDIFKGIAIWESNITWNPTTTDDIIAYACGTNLRSTMVLSQVANYYARCGISQYYSKITGILREMFVLKVALLKQPWRKAKCYIFYNKHGDPMLPRIGNQSIPVPKCCYNIVEMVKDIKNLIKLAEDLHNKIEEETGNLPNKILEISKDNTKTIQQKCEALRSIQNIIEFGPCPKLSEGLINAVNDLESKFNDLKKRAEKNNNENCETLPPNDIPDKPSLDVPPNYYSASPSLGIPGRIRPL
jgi:hypothetical protein